MNVTGRFTLIYSKVWTDAWFEGLGVNQKLLWLFLLAHPSLGRCGIIEFSPKFACFHTSISSDGVVSIIQEFEAAGKIVQENGCLLIKNFIPYQRYNGGTRTAALNDAASWAPKCPALSKLAQDLIQNGGVKGDDSEDFGNIQNDSEKFLLLKLNQKQKLEQKLELKPPPRPPKVGASAEADPLIAEAYAQSVAVIDAFTKAKGQAKMPNPAEKSLQIIDQIKRLDYIQPEEIPKIIAWALADNFWQNLILSIPQWRKKGGNGRPKIVNCHSAWKKAIGGNRSGSTAPATPVRDDAYWDKAAEQDKLYGGGR